MLELYTAIAAILTPILTDASNFPVIAPDDTPENVNVVTVRIKQTPIDTTDTLTTISRNTVDFLCNAIEFDTTVAIANTVKTTFDGYEDYNIIISKFIDSEDTPDDPGHTRTLTFTMLFDSDDSGFDDGFDDGFG